MIYFYLNMVVVIQHNFIDNHSITNKVPSKKTQKKEVLKIK